MELLLLMSAYLVGSAALAILAGKVIALGKANRRRDEWELTKLAATGRRARAFGSSNEAPRR